MVACAVVIPAFRGLRQEDAEILRPAWVITETLCQKSKLKLECLLLASNNFGNLYRWLQIYQTQGRTNAGLQSKDGAC